MIHGYNYIKLMVLSMSEKAVGTVWAEYLHPFLLQCIDGWFDHQFFLFSDQAIITGVRVQTQHRNFRYIDAEIFL
ncbi:hypothetical protein D9M68_641190 [compost metagenome]